MRRPTLLKTTDVVAGYGMKDVLKGVNLSVGQGEIVALIGHNGAGKSTLLRTVFGLVPVRRGQIMYDSHVIKAATPRELLGRGVAYIPQGNRVFGDLTVRDNLLIGGITLGDKQARKEGIEHALAMLPILRERLNQQAGTLSGGEKQMLALASALVLSPRLLLLDEPSLGLSPYMIGEALARIQELNREGGVSILIVEQKVREVLAMCHRVYCLKLGTVAFDGLPDTLRRDSEKLKAVFL